MKITLLGTGTSQGIPVIACDCAVCQSKDPKDKRLRTSVLIEIKGKKIVIDSGPDFRQQMLNAKVNDLDAILFTHEHRDHIAGLDDVRAFNFIHQKAIDVYAESRVQEAIKTLFSYSFDEKKYPGVPKLNINTINEKIFKIEGVEIIPIRAFHYKLPVLGFRIQDFTYLTDCNYIEESEKKKIIGSKFIILDALRKKPHVSHFALHEAIELVNEFSPKRGYLIHMSHQMGLHADCDNDLPPNINLAYDGLVINC